jgi:hypothetical protein
MKRTLLIALLALGGVIGLARPAAADITFFVGTSNTPEWRGVRGVSAGISMLIFGFEFDYGRSSENATEHLPGLQTGMFNVLVQTPTNTSLYVTAGGGAFRETLGPASVTNFGTNFGGGIKIHVAGPIHVRIDYRIFALKGNPIYNKPQRLYVGVNWPF